MIHDAFAVHSSDLQHVQFLLNIDQKILTPPTVCYYMISNRHDNVLCSARGLAETRYFTSDGSLMHCTMTSSTPFSRGSSSPPFLFYTIHSTNNTMAYLLVCRWKGFLRLSAHTFLLFSRLFQLLVQNE